MITELKRPPANQIATSTSINQSYIAMDSRSEWQQVEILIKQLFFRFSKTRVKYDMSYGHVNIPTQYNAISWHSLDENYDIFLSAPKIKFQMLVRTIQYRQVYQVPKAEIRKQIMYTPANLTLFFIKWGLPWRSLNRLVNVMQLTYDVMTITKNLLWVIELIFFTVIVA